MRPLDKTYLLQTSPRGNVSWKLLLVAASSLELVSDYGAGLIDFPVNEAVRRNGRYVYQISVWQRVSRLPPSRSAGIRLRSPYDNVITRPRFAYKTFGEFRNRLYLPARAA